MKTEARYRTDGIWIKDASGRVVLLRGCNLGGDSKLPARQASPAGTVGNALSFDVLFTGRPFPEEEADEHFARLAGWGFTFLRFVITWEAVEHAAPGVYDEDYLAYLRNVLKKAEAHGISVFIDPHQDAWSRWTGGDGAPGWTLEAAGFDLTKITASGSALTQVSAGKKYRPMCWGFNYLYYANATMWTLFFGGNTFAPGRLVEGVPIQDWLQDHFIAAMRHTARRLKDCDAIIGFGTLNEPHAGFIGLSSLVNHQRITAPDGIVPTAFQSIAAASGFPQRVKRVALAGLVTLPVKATLNPDGVSIFREGALCPWKDAGVWTIEGDVPVVKKDNWFAQVPEWARVNTARMGAVTSATATAATATTVDPIGEYFLKPFQKRFMEEVSKKHEHYLFFAEGVPHGHRACWTAEDRLRSDGTTLNVVEAFHWYDGFTLLLKSWKPWRAADSDTSALSFGPGAARRSAIRQICRYADRSRSVGIPPFLGEFGVPMDLNRGSSYRTGNYKAQEDALGSFYDAVDAALTGSTLWNYSASNTHEAGDGWNGEDLSIYSASTGEARALRGFSRPYAMAVAGIPVAMCFNRKKREFTLEWDGFPCDGSSSDGASVDASPDAGVTEIFVPSHWYPEGWRSSFSGGDAELEEGGEKNRLFVRTQGLGRFLVRVYPLGD